MTKQLFSTCLVVLTVLFNTFEAQIMNNYGCPNLPSVDYRTIREIYSVGPRYVVFVPTDPFNLALDNICYTVSGLPDDFNTLLLPISRVFRNGSNEVNSNIVSQPQIGVTRYASSRCSFLDIPFATVTLEGTGECGMVLLYRCVLGGDCGSEFDVYPPIFGMSYTPRPISNMCIQKAKFIIRSFGFPDRAYNTYPMRLPTRCIF